MSKSTPHNPLLPADEQRIVRSFRLSRLILPVLLGFGAVAVLFYYQFDYQQFKQINWTVASFGWIGLAFLLLLARHCFYALRLRALTQGQFSWIKCLQLVVIWEFSSALTPTSKGGGIVMLFVLTKEGLSGGRTAAAVFYSMLCDSGFFVLLLPLLLGVYGPPMLYPGMQSYSDVGLASSTFFITYTLMAAYWLLLVVLLVLRPDVARYLLDALARLPFLRRYAARIGQWGSDFALAAVEMRRESWRVHIQVVAATIGVWTCKFLMINCLMVAIVPSIPVDGSTQAFIYARLVAMFIIMSFSPTPGGAGLAEVALAGFIGDYVPKGIGLIVALMWRGMAYYGYLLAGAIVVPRWLAGLRRGGGTFTDLK